MNAPNQVCNFIVVLYTYQDYSNANYSDEKENPQEA